ncbi:MAG: DUF2723 domain-containing protein, partial [Candidatus Hydrogenedentota bacterium]
LAYRLNLLSALLASCTLVLLYFIILFLVNSRPIAIACALIFGVTYTFWENSIIAAVYSLNALFMCGVLLLMLQWSKGKRPLFFYLGCLVYALSFGNHLIGITMLPALAYWTFAVDHRVLLKKKTYFLLTLFVLLGIAQYGYVLLRSYQHTPQKKVFQYWPYTEDFGRTHMEVSERSILGVLDKATGGGYGRSRQIEMRWKSRLGESPAAEAVRGRFTFLRDLTLRNFAPVGALLALTGIGLAFVRERKRAIFLLLIILSHLAFILTWGIPVNDVQVIPGYLMLAIFIAHNANLFVVPPLPRHPNACRAGRACLTVLLVGLTLFLAASRYRKIDQSDNVWLANMTDTVLSQIPDDSLVFTNHLYAVALWYKLYGEQARPGARITVHPIWKVYREDLDYGLRHYRHVFYFLDEPYWPILERMGIPFETHTFSESDLREYLSARPPGDYASHEILAVFANINGRASARNIADALKIPMPGPGRLALAGIVEAGGNVRIFAAPRGSLSLAKGAEFGNTKLPTDIVVVPGEAIYVSGRSCSRHMKANNLVLIDALTGGVNDMVYVDWRRSAEVEPVHFLLVK